MMRKKAEIISSPPLEYEVADLLLGLALALALTLLTEGCLDTRSLIANLFLGFAGGVAVRWAYTRWVSRSPGTRYGLFSGRSRGWLLFILLFLWGIVVWDRLLPLVYPVKPILGGLFPDPSGVAAFLSFAVAFALGLIVTEGCRGNVVE